jgi:hypothetical protein
MKNRAKIDKTRAKPTRTQPWTSPNITQPRWADLTKAGEKTLWVLWEEQTQDAPTKKSTI